jgi:hypothetical protein
MRSTPEADVGGTDKGQRIIKVADSMRRREMATELVDRFIHSVFQIQK